MLSRKQREIKSREALILDTALAILKDAGLAELSMQRIAFDTEYSKGTIYQHFSCKEEVVVALALRSAKQLFEMMQRARNYPGNARIKITVASVAYGLFVKLNPVEFEYLCSAKSVAYGQKINDSLTAELKAMDVALMGLMTDVFAQALDEVTANNNGVNPSIVSATEATFGCWALMYGALEIQANGWDLSHVGINDIAITAGRCAQVFMDGLNIQPLSGEFDAQAIMQEALTSEFSYEFSLLK
jgi:AcrR family transcriptional regulator